MLRYTIPHGQPTRGSNVQAMGHARAIFAITLCCMLDVIPIIFLPHLSYMILLYTLFTP